MSRFYPSYLDNKELSSKAGETKGLMTQKILSDVAKKAV